MAAMDEVSVRIDDEQQFEDIPESGKFNRPTVAFLKMFNMAYVF